MRCANYLCNAAIILSASKLGHSVGAEGWATTILETKTLPPVISLGFLMQKAQQAIEIVNLRGKGDEGDKKAFEILTEYKCI